MTENSIFRALHSPVLISHQLSLVFLLENSEFSRVIGAPEIDKEKAEEVARLLGCTLDDIYVSSSGYYPYFYYKDYIFIDLIGLDADILSFMQLKERIEAQTEKLNSLMEKGDYEGIFYFIDKKVLFAAYMDMFDDIPSEQVYPVFKNIYTRSDYGFSSLDVDSVEEIFSYISDEHRSEMLEKLKPFVENGHLRVYRGEGVQSTPYDRAYSWTLDIETARYFAKRHGDNGKVYTTVIPINYVVDYITSRGEAEILLHPNNISVDDVEELGGVDDTSVINSLSDYMQGIFNGMSDKLNPEWFQYPWSIHGVRHCTRVLLHTCNFADKLDLGPSDIRLLALSALYHDIGRIHDSEDPDHGYRSWKKLTDLKLYKPDSQEEEAVLRFIIENHCLHDADGEINLSDYQIKDKKKALYLYNIFKDADGLDRVRLGDLDLSYMRLPETQTMSRFATKALQEITEVSHYE